MSRVEDAFPRFSEGVRLFHSGNYDAAIVELTESINIFPDHLQAYHYRARAYQALGMEEQARADLEQSESIRAARWGLSSRGQETEQDRKFSWIGFALTALPIVALSVFSIPSNPCFGGTTAYWRWFVAGGIWVFALITGMVFRRVEEKDIASGILAGIVVGLLALSTTCAVNLNGLCI